MQSGHTSRRFASLLGLRLLLKGRGRHARAVLWYAAVLLSLAQLLGVTHAVADYFEPVADAKHCADRCPNEEESADAECPPFCPTCSCAHASRPLLASPFDGPQPTLLAPPQLLALPHVVWLYDNPLTIGIFRPPRRQQPLT